MYYRNWTDKAGKLLMRPGNFMGFDWNIGDPMTFKLIHCNAYAHKRNVVVLRGVVILSSLTETGNNSALVPKSDTYFPVV